MIYFKNTQNKVYAYESLEDRNKYGKPDLVEITEQEALAIANPEPSPEQQANNIRSQRNALLQQSDWTQVANAPVDTQAWATYRQALRDITEQPGFPDNVQWPAIPGSE